MDPSKMKVVDLRSELGALGLDTKGNKPALVERLKKALESKTGKVFADTTILDTSTEDVEDTPKRPGPASRTTRRASSSRVAGTPSKNGEDEEESTPVRAAPRTTRRTSSSRLMDGQTKSRDDIPETIQEDMKEEESSKPAPQPVPAPAFVGPQAKPDDEVYSIDDEKSQSPIEIKDDINNEDESMETSGDQQSNKKDDEKMEVDEKKNDDAEEDAEKDKEKDKNRELTEEEEWEIMNERLKAKEEERREQERLRAEEKAKKLEELSQNPRKLTRFKYRQGKRAWWNNYYGGVGNTGEALTLPEEAVRAGKKEVPTEVKVVSEPELNDHKITLSWYDSDLNQHLELPELTSVVPLTEGAFAHAWAGARASHGLAEGRVCFEVRIGSVVTSMETGDKEPVGSGLRVGWSTEDSSLHLGEGEYSWGFETNGRAVHNGEFKEYGQQVNEGDVIGAYLDLSSNRCQMSYTLNGVELGVAYEFDRGEFDKPLFPHILTKNICYKVNFGYEKYNLLTKTKILRFVERIPVAQAIEEKKALEAEIKRKKEEIARREKERRDREKKDREERQRKKKEEREKLEKERKEKEAQEKKDKGEEEVKPSEEPEKMEEAADGQDAGDKDKDSAPKENGEPCDKPPEVKEEPMEVEPPAPVPPPEVQDAEVKAEPASGADDDVQVVSMEDFMKSPVIDKRIKFVDRVTTAEELDGTEGCLVPGYILLAHADLVDGPRRPASLAECEVILMVGMPGSGKTYWAKQHVAAHPEKRYNVISTGALFDKMKVDCKPFRTSYEGRWDAMVAKCAKCVLKLLEMAKGRRRNFILDQTNVYPSAQRRKLREFDGYRRVAVVIVTDEETYRDRQKRREEADGKEVPDGAIGDMKANFSLPEKGAWLDDVMYPELSEEEARKVVEAFHKEAKAAGVVKEKRSRSATRDAPPAKRQRSADKPRHARNERRPRDPPRDREDRWGIGGGGAGGGGGRWGPVNRAGGGGGGGGGRGGRWGRDRDGPGIPPPGPPAARFDRWGPPPRGNNEFGRDRDGFRGGRGGGMGGMGGGMGGMGGMGGGGRGERAGGRGPAGPGNDPARFRPERTSRPPPHAQDKRALNAPPQGGGGGAGGAGGWQRGGAGGGAAGPAPRAHGQMRPAQRNAPQKPGQVSEDPQVAAMVRGQKNIEQSSAKRQDGQNQMSQNQNNPQQNQQGWNQWAGGWGGWGGNWNQNQAGWGNWSNWPNWAGNQANSGGSQAGGAGGAGGAVGAGGAGGKGQGAQATPQWPANYTAQQWYQWQQWQQQQQQWQGYQQGNQQGGAGNTPDAQAWAQYYQNYSGANAAANANAAVGDKK